MSIFESISNGIGSLADWGEGIQDDMSFNQGFDDGVSAARDLELDDHYQEGFQAGFEAG
jgi:hypothetical protein